MNRLSDVGQWGKDWLEDARSTYEEFKEYDEDGFWLDQVRVAEDDSYNAEAPLRRAQANLVDLRQQLAVADTELAAMQAAEQNADAAFAPYEPKLAELEKATSAEALARVDLALATDEVGRRGGVGAGGGRRLQNRRRPVPLRGAVLDVLTMDVRYGVPAGR